MKRSFFQFVTFFLLGLNSLIWAENIPIKIHSKAAILMELDSKNIIFQKNAYQSYSPASITKLPSALYIIKKGKLAMDSVITADQDTIGSITKKYSLENNYKYPPHWLVLGGTHMRIHKGEQVRVKDLLHGMLLISANDASNVLAKHSSGSIQVFMKELNKYLKDLGCKNTHFKNPHGLHFPKHTTTAFDMALVACEAMKEPSLCKILKTKRYKINATNKKTEHDIHNENKLLNKKSAYYYPYAIGGKQGFHNTAKHTMIAAAKKGDKILVVVLLQCPSRHQKYEDAIKLFEHGFKNIK